MSRPLLTAVIARLCMPAGAQQEPKSAGPVDAVVHVREGIVDPDSLNVDFAALRPAGRLCGNMYARQRDMFELKRITYAEWRAGPGKVQAGSS